MDTVETVFYNERTMLSSEQIKTLSAILADLGQVAVVSIVLPFIFLTFSEDAVSKIIFGSLLSLFFWVSSVLLVKNIH